MNERRQHITKGRTVLIALKEYERMFALRLSSRFVRVSSRGIQFSTMAALRNVSRLASTVKNVLCLPTPDALCSEGDSLVYFPDADVDIPYDFSQIRRSSLTRHFPNGTCTRPNSNRVIDVADRRYEVSLCDLIDGNLDIVLDTVHDTIFWRRDTTSTVEFVFVSGMSVYIMSCVSANVVNISKDRRRFSGIRRILTLPCSSSTSCTCSWVGFRRAWSDGSTSVVD